jgi:DNA replication protein DnaC
MDIPNLPETIQKQKCSSEKKILKPGDPLYFKTLAVTTAKEVCPEFIFTPEHQRVMNIMISYFFGLKNGVLESEKIDPLKSIVLCGPYGVGKTIMFKIVHKMIEKRFVYPPDRKMTFKDTSIEEIVNAMRSDGDYMDGELFNYVETIDGCRIKRPLNLLINEFGVEYTGKHYGTPISELIDVFLMKRYEIFQVSKRMTHATMNYNADELKSKFSARLTDRFRQMFNIIPVTGKSFRK